MARTRKQLEALILPNIPTETLLRKWERRLQGSLSKEYSVKCKYFIKLYGGD